MVQNEILASVRDIAKNKTNKISLDERVQVFLNEDFQKELAKRLKCHRAASATRISLVLCFIASILLGLLEFKVKVLFWVFWIPAVLGVFFFRNPYRGKKEVVWEFLREYLKTFGFEIGVHEEYYGKLMGISSSEFRDLINKESAKYVTIEDSGLYFKSHRACGMVRKCSATEVSKTEKGEIKRKVFDGVLVELDRIWGYEEKGGNTAETKVNLQIQPISKLGRLIQNTVSTLSETMSDIRFYNEDLNDVMVMQSENFIFEKAKINEKMARLHTAALENVLYEIWQNYGVFYLKFYNGRLYLAFNQQGLFHKKTFDSSKFPSYSMSDESFNPVKWAELFYFIGVLEALTYYFRKFNELDKEDEDEYAKDYSDLTVKTDYSDNVQCRKVFEEFRRRAAFPSITTLEKIKQAIEDTTVKGG